MKRSIRKLKRIELVELLYQLRKDNIKLRKKCKELSRQLKNTERLLDQSIAQGGNEAIARIEKMLSQLCEDGVLSDGQAAEE